MPPHEKRPNDLPLWERPFCTPDGSLGALTSTSTLARIFVRAASISRHVRDGRPAVLRAACVPWLLRHRRSVFCAAMTRLYKSKTRLAREIYMRCGKLAFRWRTEYDLDHGLENTDQGARRHEESRGAM